MYLRKRDLLLALFIGLLRLAQASKNYPSNYYNRKPCAHLQNTINVQAELCRPEGGGYNPDTEKNCVDTLKVTCPEFNKAECTQKGDKHACRLWYEAQNSVWLEIFYVNFNPYNLTLEVMVWDIIEWSRTLRAEDCFGKRQQGDFPASVQDPTGARGLKWQTILESELQTTLPENATRSPDGTAICADNAGNLLAQDVRCDTSLKGYFALYYYLGLNISSHDELNIVEANYSATKTWQVEPKCMWMALPAKATNSSKATRATSCQLRIIRKVSYNITDKGSNGVNDAPGYHESFFEIEEIQVFRMPGGSNTSNTIWYAFWSKEDPNTRDQIFSSC